MFYVYVLESQLNAKRYIGSTSKDPQIRLKEHNNGSNKWTKANKPFVLIHVEEFSNQKEALQREIFLKSGKGRDYLEHHIPR
ncbi:MAG: hypothetical protein A2452_10890 [Candidatus Firestonebacteria bacterium RIFOXYC2_FULL_39_67]|nr:MAG: hypothetical protein A2536_08790 [Candidatus Firestonebacteria bacterium RIFOXYD2_FULL_39_29]OGF56033.1 MAG: hypothetical protein A2452_10890 [Candidatus Firestonebacteria bacterium RIFOXYC2_FULL_39_67]